MLSIKGNHTAFNTEGKKKPYFTVYLNEILTMQKDNKQNKINTYAR